MNTTHVRVKQADPERPWMWYETHVGETFKVRAFHRGIPNQWEVDVSSLSDMSPTARGIAYIPECDAEPTQPDG